MKPPARHVLVRVLAVGDDDQSIYAFRGARGQHGRLYCARISGAPPDQAGAELPQPQQHPGQRQRAHQPQRQAAGQNLRTDQGPGEPVRVHEATTDFAQAQWLVEEAQPLRDQGARRVTRDAKSPFSTAAMPKAVCWKRRCSMRAFLPRVWRTCVSSSAPRSNALAYLRLLENPNDDTSFLRVVNSPRVASVPAQRGNNWDLAQDMGCSSRCGQRSRWAMRGQPLPASWPRSTYCASRQRHEPARHRGPDARPKAACWPITRLTAKVKTGWRTWMNWSTPPKAFVHAGRVWTRCSRANGRGGG